MKLSLSTLSIAALLTALITVSCSGPVRPPKLNEAIYRLDVVLATRADTIANRIESTALLSAQCAADPSTENMLAVADAFDGINNDSAIVYTFNALNGIVATGDTAQARLVAIDFARRLAKSALLRPAISILDRIDVDSLNREGKAKFYGVKSSIFIDAANAQTLKYLREQYTTAAIAALDTLDMYIAPESDTAHIVEAQLHYLRGKTDLALGELNEVFDRITPDEPIYAIAAGLMAEFNKSIPGKENEYLYYLTLASTADALKANGEAASLVELGTEFFKQGDLDRAYRYLSAAGECVVRSNSKKLYPKVAPTMSVLVDAMREHEAKRTAWMTGLIISLITIVLCIAVLLWHFAKKNTRRRRQNRLLNASITTRDQYIKQLLDLCSVYVDGMEEFNRLVSRKLKVNQTQDLFKMIESGKLLQDQTTKFFDVFDAAIANIYPDFISELNTLLQPDRQLSPLPGGKLTPELRIVAFMRLGVTDSTRLSKFLGLSLNTVYTYRNRMKNRAVNRDTFEADVLKIGKNA